MPDTVIVDRAEPAEESPPPLDGLPLLQNSGSL